MTGETTGAMVVTDDSTDSFPCVRYRQSFYVIPKEKFLLKIKSPFRITYDQFLAMHNTKGNNASKSPKEWAPFISQRALALLRSMTGSIPCACSTSKVTLT